LAAKNILTRRANHRQYCIVGEKLGFNSAGFRSEISLRADIEVAPYFGAMNSAPRRRWLIGSCWRS
jgi:hypothetical protein